jgi:hypothetical protein
MRFGWNTDNVYFPIRFGWNTANVYFPIRFGCNTAKVKPQSINQSINISLLKRYCETIVKKHRFINW